MLQFLGVFNHFEINVTCHILSDIENGAKVEIRVKFY